MSLSKGPCRDIRMDPHWLVQVKVYSMQRRSSKVFGILFTAALTLTSVAVPARGENVFARADVGKTAPMFSLKDPDGKTVSLSSFANKVVVLEWFDDKCPFDKKHYNSGNMQSIQKDYAKKGVVWLIINSAGPGKPGFHTGAEYKDIMKSWKFESPYFLQDPDGAVGHLYGAKTTPDMYIIGKNGKVLYSGAIDDQPDADIESIKIAKNYVRMALDEVLAGKPVTTSTTKSYG